MSTNRYGYLFPRERAKQDVESISSFQHGSLPGGNLHSTATTEIAGFMSADDKLQLDSLTGGSDQLIVNRSTGNAIVFFEDDETTTQWTVAVGAELTLNRFDATGSYEDTPIVIHKDTGNIGLKSFFDDGNALRVGGNISTSDNIIIEGTPTVGSHAINITYGNNTYGQLTENNTWAGVNTFDSVILNGTTNQLQYYSGSVIQWTLSSDDPSLSLNYFDATGSYDSTPLRIWTATGNFGIKSGFDDGSALRVGGVITGTDDIVGGGDLTLGSTGQIFQGTNNLINYDVSRSTVEIGNDSGADPSTSLGVFVGGGAGSGSLSNQSTFIGYFAGNSANGFGQTSIGYYALQNSTGFANTALGYQAGKDSSSGTSTYLGYQAGIGDTGSGNIFVGYDAGSGSVDNNQFIVSTGTNTPLLEGDLSTGLLNVQDIQSRDWTGSGYFSTGYELTNAGDLTAESILLRGALRAQELIIDQVNAVGGTLLLSSARGKIVRAFVSAGRNIVELEDPNDRNSSQFQFGDIFWIKAIDIDGALISNVVGYVDGTFENTVEIDIVSGSINDIKPGDVIVQRGHLTDVTRQNLIYITASDPDSPFTRYMSGIDSIAAFTDQSKVTAQVGDLTNIDDATGNGLYSSNAFLTGQLLVGDLTKVGNYLEYNNGDLTGVFGNIQFESNQFDLSATNIGLSSNNGGTFNVGTVLTANGAGNSGSFAGTDFFADYMIMESGTDSAAFSVKSPSSSTATEVDSRSPFGFSVYRDAGQTEIATTGLESYFKLDSGTGTTLIDEESNPNIVGVTKDPNADWTTNGVVNSGLVIPSATPASWIDFNMGSTPNFWNQTAFSFSFWMRPDDINDGSDHYAFADFSAAVLYYDVSFTSGMGLWIYQGGSLGVSATTNTRLNQGQLYHIVVTYDSTNGGKIYIDGQLAASSTAVTGTFDAGSQYWGFGSAATGLLDEVRYHNREISAAEVQALYENPTGVETATGFNLFRSGRISAQDTINNFSTNDWGVQLQSSGIDRLRVDGDTAYIANLDVAGPLTMITNGEIKNAANTFSISNAGISVKGGTTFGDADKAFVVRDNSTDDNIAFFTAVGRQVRLASINNADLAVSPDSGRDFLILNLPTTNPGGSNKVWNDGGTLKIT